MADRFARLNCKLVLWDVNEAGLEEVVKEVRVYGVSCKAYAVDLSSRELIYAVSIILKSYCYCCVDFAKNISFISFV